MKESECFPGKRVGKLTLIRRTRIHSSVYGNRWEWLTKCDCGTYRKVLTFRLGEVSDCGNHTKEKLSENGKKGTKPLKDLADSNPKSLYRRLYVKWHDMIARCQNPKNSNYKYYGGRGISVCSEWQEYSNFKKWAIEQGYNPKIRDRKQQTIDRKNTNKNYEPSNCRLTNSEVQSFNKRNNVFITIDGITKNVTEWADEFGINRNTMQSRIDKGVRGKELLQKPTRKANYHKGELITFNGARVSFAELEQKYHLGTGTVRYRYKKLGLRGTDLIEKPKN
ncbi:hypothetical protein HF865_00600 [Lactobacillus reuteri]|uniref:AP2 domain-containing protein n=1 Tax=Limosilactobacillus reuteri TaxID=1598 RepID=A0AAW9ZD57_LIMRT|nr:hypothetical protein [Limosilactobacillus reuteri]NME21232.1 hypothetical protein [Limosilactobacillus reuteri]